MFTAVSIFAFVLAVGNSSSQLKQTCTADALRRAAFRGETARLRICFDRGTDPNLRTAGGVTLLMIASAAGQRDVVDLLLTREVNVNARTTRDGITATMFAVTFGHLPIVQLLVEKGHADLAVKDDSDRRTALEWAAVRSSLPWAIHGTKEEEEALSTEIMRYLASRGAVVRRIDIVESMLTFASVPDLSALLRAAVPMQ